MNENGVKTKKRNIILSHRKIHLVCYNATEINMDQIWILHIYILWRCVALVSIFAPSSATMLRISHACHQIRHVWVYTILNKCANYPCCLVHSTIKINAMSRHLCSVVHSFEQTNKGRMQWASSIFREFQMRNAIFIRIKCKSNCFEGANTSRTSRNKTKRKKE